MPTQSQQSFDEDNDNGYFTDESESTPPSEPPSSSSAEPTSSAEPITSPEEIEEQHSNNVEPPVQPPNIDEKRNNSENQTTNSETSESNRPYHTRGVTRDYSYRFGMEEGQNLNIIHSNKGRIENMEQYLEQCKKKPLITPQDGFGKKYGYAAHYVMVQMSAKQGLKEFGDRAVQAIKAEFHQLVHEMEVFIPKRFHSLTYDQKRKALKAITLIDHKRSGKVKGRTVANGSVQRLYIPSEEACAPTVST